MTGGVVELQLGRC